MSSTSNGNLYCSESEKSYENTMERLLRRARFMGSMDEVESSDCADGLPELHVSIDDGADPRHEDHEDCWCSPTVEYKTDYVRVYRHRRIN